MYVRSRESLRERRPNTLTTRSHQNQAPIQFIARRSIHMHLHSILRNPSATVSKCACSHVCFLTSSHIPISRSHSRLNYLPHSISSSKPCPFFRTPKFPNLHNIHDLLPGPAFNNLHPIWVLAAGTITLILGLSHTIVMSRICPVFDLPVAWLFTSQKHHASHAYVDCKLLRMGLCFIIFKVNSSPGVESPAEKHLVKSSCWVFLERLPAASHPLWAGSQAWMTCLSLPSNLSCSHYHIMLSLLSSKCFLLIHDYFLWERMGTTPLKNKFNIAFLRQGKNRYSIFGKWLPRVKDYGL